MKQLPSIKETVRDLMARMAAMFDGERHRDVDEAYQFVFTDIDGGYAAYLSFSGGRCEYGEGMHDKPVVTVRASSDVLLDVFGGLRNPLLLTVTGRLKVEGGLRRFARLPKLLTREPKFQKSVDLRGPWTKPGRVLVINASPRKKNGMTYFYLRAFVEGMERAGAAVEEVTLYEKEIRHCLGCFACWTKTPGKCVQDDDQAGLLEALEKAPLVVYAMPLYYHSMPSLLKAHFDRQLPRLYPYMEKIGSLTMHPRRVQARQGVVLLSTSGFPEPEQFAPLVSTLKAITSYQNTELLASVLVPGGMELYENPTARSSLLEALKNLRSAGEQVVKSGTVDRKVLDKLARRKLSPDWNRWSNLHWEREIEKKQKGT